LTIEEQAEAKFDSLRRFLEGHLRWKRAQLDDAERDLAEHLRNRESYIAFQIAVLRART
jgi:hypothetical protein